MVHLVATVVAAAAVYAGRCYGRWGLRRLSRLSPAAVDRTATGPAIGLTACAAVLGGVVSQTVSVNSIFALLALAFFASAGGAASIMYRPEGGMAIEAPPAGSRPS